MQRISDSGPMGAPGPSVQISPAVAQEVIALQAAELVRLRAELGNERSEFLGRDPHGIVSLEQFNELRRDLLDAVFTPKESSDLRTELVVISDRLRTMQGSLKEFISQTTRVSVSDNGTQFKDGGSIIASPPEFYASKIDALQHQLNNLQGELSDARSINLNLEDQRVKNEARVSDLVKQLFAAHVESRDLQDLLKGAQDSCTATQTTVFSMEAEMILLREENRQLKQRVESLSAESNQRQLELDDLNERYASTVARHEEEVASLYTAVEVMKDVNARPGLLGTMRNKVAQVYKGVGGYLPHQPATSQSGSAEYGEPSRTTILVEEPLSDVNAQQSTLTLRPHEKSRVDEAVVSCDSESSTAGSVVSLGDLASDSEHTLEEPAPVTVQPVPLPDVNTTRPTGRISATDVSGCDPRAVTEKTAAAGPSQLKASKKIEDVLTPLPMKVITQAALDHLQRVGSRWPLLTDDRD
ncbi:hypothetical protein DAEQUDRAFT_729622 [Daedalea quercina L-15889]|uniref:Uncharacterized protein n=1 Tax=Daedalea quercina L-15889 TaxID=1314783 RepID=A0A165NIZ1_9APHY|nr:hypothetical protein DAEQUDRAFT_729622 [Daedalea quercina L-15889]